MSSHTPNTNDSSEAIKPHFLAALLTLAALATVTLAQLLIVSPAVLQPGHLDTPALEQEIAEWMGSWSAHRFTVNCPADRAPQEGRVFTCEAIAEPGATWNVEVTAAKRSSVSWRLAEPRT